MSTTLTERQLSALRAGLAWLYDIEQPAGAMLDPIGITMVADDRSYSFSVFPTREASKYDGGPVAHICSSTLDGRPLVVDDELTAFTASFVALGHVIVDHWGMTEDEETNFLSMRLERPALRSLLAAVDRFDNGCPEHGLNKPAPQYHGHPTCGCEWYQESRSRLVLPNWPMVSTRWVVGAPVPADLLDGTRRRPPLPRGIRHMVWFDVEHPTVRTAFDAVVS